MPRSRVDVVFIAFGPLDSDPVSDRPMTTTQVAILLGLSRQHVADLGDRGEIPCWKAGTHRRFHRIDVLAYQHRKQAGGRPVTLASMGLTDRRSLAYGLLVAEKLVVSAELVVDQARRNLGVQRKTHSDGSADHYLDAWEKLLAGPAESLVRVLTSLDQESVALRHAAPFAGVLTEAERLSVIESTRRTAA
jgi:excisionase family DNA binding protein